MAIADSDASAPATVSALRAYVTSAPPISIVFEPVPATRLVRVRATAPTADQAIRAVSDVASLYVHDRQGAATASLAHDLDDLSRQRASVDGRIDALRQQLAKITATAFADAAVPAASNDDALAASHRAQLEVMARHMDEASALDAVPAIGGDHLVVALKAQERRLIDWRASLEQQDAPASSFVGVDQAIDKTRSDLHAAEARLAGDFRRDYDTARYRERAAEEASQAVRAQATRAAERSAEASALFAGLETLRDESAALGTRQRALEAALASVDSGARLVGVAEIAPVAVESWLALLALVAAGVAGALSLAPRTHSGRIPSRYSRFRLPVRRPRMMPARRRVA